MIVQGPSDAELAWAGGLIDGEGSQDAKKYEWSELNGTQ